MARWQTGQKPVASLVLILQSRQAFHIHAASIPSVSNAHTGDCDIDRGAASGKDIVQPQGFVEGSGRIPRQSGIEPYRLIADANWPKYFSR